MDDKVRKDRALAAEDLESFTLALDWFMPFVICMPPEGVTESHFRTTNYDNVRRTPAT